MTVLCWLGIALTARNIPLYQLAWHWSDLSASWRTSLPDWRKVGGVIVRIIKIEKWLTITPSVTSWHLPQGRRVWVECIPFVGECFCSSICNVILPVSFCSSQPRWGQRLRGQKRIRSTAIDLEILKGLPLREKPLWPEIWKSPMTRWLPAYAEASNNRFQTL